MFVFLICYFKALERFFLHDANRKYTIFRAKNSISNMFRGYVLMCFTFGTLFSRGFVKGDIEAQEIDLKKKLLADYEPSLSPILYAKDDYYSLIKFNIYRIRGLLRVNELGVKEYNMGILKLVNRYNKCVSECGDYVEKGRKLQDEKKGEFIVEGQILLAWMDERFTWEDSQVTEIRISSKKIWMPSIYIYNAIEPEEMTLEPSPVIIQRGVLWAPCYTIRTRCIPNLRYYPFDKNVCDIVITPRNIEEDFLSINTSSQSIFYKGFIKTKDMLDNPRWDYDDPKVYVKKIKIDNDFERDVVVYSFSIQRSMPLIPLGILTPCMACSLLFLTTFWMEAGCTLRAGLCVTSTLVCSSCLFTLSKILPASGSSTPIIVEYVSITLILSTFSSIQATLATVFRRCEMLPPVSYETIISKIPSWCLVLMGIVPEKILSQQLDQTFLFSELDDQENRQVYIKEDNPSNGEQSAEPLLMQSLWIKYIILFDRAMFYLLGIIFILFVISVIVTE